MTPNSLQNQHIICQALFISNINTHITYLGTPLFFKRLKVVDFLPRMKSFTKKITCWKVNLLSFEGSLQYLKFTVINSIAYWIRGSILPKTVIKFIRKASSRYLFFDNTSAVKKMCVVSMDKVCKPKNYGRLGLSSLLALQFAFNCTVISKIITMQLLYHSS